MLFMNEYEIDHARSRWAKHPVLSKATQVLSELRDLVDGHSDGWCYWKAPVLAAKSLMELIKSGDATEEQLKKALTPIKSFLTRNAEGFKGQTLPFFTPPPPPPPLPITKWKDGCGHPPETFVGTCVCHVHHTNPIQTVSEVLDVYVYPGKYDWSTGPDVCIRWGNEPSEYYSPTSLIEMTKSAAQMEPYQAALQLILEKGKIEYVRNS